MLLSFSALVYLDLHRRSATRYDFLPCMKASAQQDGKMLTDLLTKYIYGNIYKPMVSSRIGRVVLLALSSGLLVAAAFGLATLNVGLDLHDFFPEGTSAGKFAQDRNTYFPLWPVAVN